MFFRKPYRRLSQPIPHWLSIFALLACLSACETPGTKPITVAPLPKLLSSQGTQSGEMVLLVNGTTSNQDQSSITIVAPEKALHGLLIKEYAHQGWTVLQQKQNASTDSPLEIIVTLTKLHIEIEPSTATDNVLVSAESDIEFNESGQKKKKTIRHKAQKEVFMKARNKEIKEHVESVLAQLALQIATTAR